MSPRLRKTLTGAVVLLGGMVAIALLLVPADDRAFYLTVFVPLFVALAALVDYFFWRNPKRLRGPAAAVESPAPHE